MFNYDVAKLHQWCRKTRASDYRTFAYVQSNAEIARNEALSLVFRSSAVQVLWIYLRVMEPGDEPINGIVGAGIIRKDEGNGIMDLNDICNIILQY